MLHSKTQIQRWPNKNVIFQFLSSDKDLQLVYKTCHARMLDFRLKFIEAAQEYYELSNCSSLIESDRLAALKNSLVCTILSSASKI